MCHAASCIKLTPEVIRLCKLHKTSCITLISRRCQQVPARVDVLSSHDGGVSWSLAASVAGMYWANLFLHDGAAYLLGTGGVGGGAVAIARSDDGGGTWRSTELFRLPDRAVGSYATGATPVLFAQGRLWRAFELWRSPHRRAQHASCACEHLEQQGGCCCVCAGFPCVCAKHYSLLAITAAAGGMQTLSVRCDSRGMLCFHRWPEDFEAVLISAPESSDLMDPASWAMTPPLAFDDTWLRGHGLPGTATAGYLEGGCCSLHPCSVKNLPVGSGSMQHFPCVQRLLTSFT